MRITNYIVLFGSFQHLSLSQSNSVGSAAVRFLSLRAAGCSGLTPSAGNVINYPLRTFGLHLSRAFGIAYLGVVSRPIPFEEKSIKTMRYFILTIAAALAFSACMAPASNAPANANIANTNSNANMAKSSAPPPTQDALVALDHKAFEAWKNKDTKFWDTFISDRFAAIEPTGKIDKAAVLKHFSTNECEVKSYSTSDEQMKSLGNDAALLTYKATADATCRGQKEPAQSWAATLFVREGDQWKAAFHSENPIADANDKSAKPMHPAEKPADKSSATASPATEAKSDAATDALLAQEKKAWEAWKAKDAKTLDDWAASDLVAFTSKGRADRATALKGWAEDGCDVKSVSLTDPSHVSFGTDYALLLFKASTDGKCQGSAIPTEYGASVYHNEAGTWKAVFTMGTEVQ